MTRLENELFCSIDLESDGPCPPMNSMLSLGCVAFTLRDGILGEFTHNFELLPGAKPHPETEKFWADNPEAFTATRVNAIDPKEAMGDLTHFIDVLAIGRTPVFAGYPAGFDFTFTYWYYHRFLDFCPFKWQAWDFKSYAMAVEKTAFRDMVKSKMPKVWFPPTREHNHVALNDARDQAKLFINVLCLHNDLPNPIKEK